MEFIRPIPTWEEFQQVRPREIFRKFRTPGEGRETDPRGQRVRRAGAAGRDLRKLTDEEMAVYRAPFPTPQSRLPTWRFPNELPIAGEPADVYAMLERRTRRSPASAYPKLLFGADPGALVSPAFAEGFACDAHTIAGSSSSARARISCRRIIPRRSAARSRRGSGRSRAGGRRRRRRKSASTIASSQCWRGALGSALSFSSCRNDGRHPGSVRAPPEGMPGRSGGRRPYRVTPSSRMTSGDSGMNASPGPGRAAKPPSGRRGGWSVRAV